MSKTKNTSTKRDIAVWYIGKDDMWSGPFKVTEIIQSLLDRQISGLDFVWSPSTGNRWVRICVVPEFQPGLLQAPAQSLIDRIMESQKAKDNEDTPPATLSPKGSPVVQTWYLQYDGSEFGPLSLIEIQQIVNSKKLAGPLFAWRPGFAKWLPVKEVVELTKLNQETKILPVQTDSSNKRTKARLPFLAAVKYTTPGDISRENLKYTGISRDISEGGMLIMSKEFPGATGDQLFVRVEPASDVGIPNFEIVGQVRRVLQNAEGFGVEFKQMPKKLVVILKEYSNTRK
jgi:PilZ domain/GYF domain 2